MPLLLRKWQDIAGFPHTTFLTQLSLDSVVTDDNRLFVIVGVDSLGLAYGFSWGSLNGAFSCSQQGGCFGYVLVEVDPVTLLPISHWPLSSAQFLSGSTHLAAGSTPGDLIAVTGGETSTVVILQDEAQVFSADYAIDFSSIAFVPGLRDEFFFAGEGLWESLEQGDCECNYENFYGRFKFQLSNFETEWVQSFIIDSFVGTPKFAEPVLPGDLWVLNYAVVGGRAVAVSHTMDRLDQVDGVAQDQIVFSTAGFGMTSFSPLYDAHRAFLDPTAKDFQLVAIFELAGPSNTVGISCEVGSQQAAFHSTAVLGFSTPTTAQAPPIVFEDSTCGGTRSYRRCLPARSNQCSWPNLYIVWRLHIMGQFHTPNSEHKRTLHLWLRRFEPSAPGALQSQFG